MIARRTSSQIKQAYTRAAYGGKPAKNLRNAPQATTRYSSPCGADISVIIAPAGWAHAYWSGGRKIDPNDPLSFLEKMDNVTSFHVSVGKHHRVVVTLEGVLYFGHNALTGDRSVDSFFNMQQDLEFDLVLQANNEYGHVSMMVAERASIMELKCAGSIDDTVTSETLVLIAKLFLPFKPVS